MKNKMLISMMFSALLFAGCGVDAATSNASATMASTGGDVCSPAVARGVVTEAARNDFAASVGTGSPIDVGPVERVSTLKSNPTQGEFVLNLTSPTLQTTVTYSVTIDDATCDVTDIEQIPAA